MRQWCTGEEGEGTLGRDKKPESRASLLAQSVKSLPAMQETWVQFLGQEDVLEKGMTTQSSILAWRIPWTEEPGSLQSMGSQRVRHNGAYTQAHTHPLARQWLGLHAFMPWTQVQSLVGDLRPCKLPGVVKT